MTFLRISLKLGTIPLIKIAHHLHLTLNDIHLSTTRKSGLHDYMMLFLNTKHQLKLHYSPFAHISSARNYLIRWQKSNFAHYSIQLLWCFDFSIASNITKPFSFMYGSFRRINILENRHDNDIANLATYKFPLIIFCFSFLVSIMLSISFQFQLENGMVFTEEVCSRLLIDRVWDAHQIFYSHFTCILCNTHTILMQRNVNEYIRISAM